PHGGTYSFYSGAGNYLSNTMTLAAPISLPASGTSTLSYWAWYDIELGWDNAYVAISTNGGTTWDILATYTGAAGWNRYTHDISAYNGQTVLVRSLYITDYMIYEEGIYFDDIVLATLDETAQWSVGGGQTDLALTGRPVGTWLYTVRAQDGGDNWSGLSNIRSATVACGISGTITKSGGGPLAGVEVTADGHSATTAGDGTYAITGLTPGTYTVTPALTEYTFAPPDDEVILTQGAPEATGVDFVGTQETYSISGTVVDEEDAPLEGATITIDAQSTTTLSDGTYTISGFVADTYTVTPSLTEHKFTPTSSPATVNESVGDATGVDFVGTDKIHSISGTVTNAGDPLAGVDVTADSKSATTAANGTYMIDGLVAGTYTVTPSMPEYDFAPLSTEVSVSDALGEATDVDFVGTQKTYTISGTIVNEQAEPMEGVELSANSKSTTTGPDGTYTLEELVAGIYSVKPTFSEYDFTPSETNVTVNENDGPATDVDFVGSPKQYTISGTILDWEDNAMSGVEVSANGHSATTDASGEYSIADPVAGTYTVTPEQAGRGFVPDSQEVTVNENVGDVSDIDFTGYTAYTTQLLAGLSLVGVPCQPVTDDLSEVFATDEVFRWGPDREPPGYLGPGDPGAGSLLALAAGKGYFVRHTTPQESLVLGCPVPTNVTFQLPLGANSGWNLVANPFPQTLPFSNLMIEASHILPYGFLYDTATGSYQVVTDKVGVNITRNSLEPWEGMWIRALQSPATLFIQPQGPAPAEAESVVRAADLGPRGWAIPITARVGDRADLSSVCGVSGNQAAYQIDNPPAVADAVDLYLVTEEGRHLAHDVRPAGVGETTWDFVVCTDIPDSEVQVRLSDLSAVPHDLTVLLTDLDAQRTVYARTVPLYTFHSSAETVTVRHFRLQVIPKSDAGLVISSAAAHRAPAGLTIAYTVSQPCAVTIEITNISGRLISRVCNAQPVAAGGNITTWSLRSHQGSQVPSGRYLICLQAVAANGQSVTRIVSTQVVR
ncbi:MAG: carboxypeptidase regulatory-like domain-containing protein, partial [Armatimonadetes bacterium]|nr:carboxypeptidase regulatory-like domain-containing protein [Armatimonadota bacterium]